MMCAGTPRRHLPGVNFFIHPVYFEYGIGILELALRKNQAKRQAIHANLEIV